ncbi:hypothetical protein CVT25_000794 [Psilocybe cyanescens]|uniref:Uncharacterized protein n=1 Tax=Psilocybe cyanescens TaxID=93625 RepID=A0A409XMA1_PSICY|nr:hypothetical protein CVT25_000794 [Psilocybe cyanescens]
MHASRAEQRKQRLIEAEMEQVAEEAGAPHMTEEQGQLLMQPFATVNAEFAVLDGLRWTQTVLPKLQEPRPVPYSSPANADGNVNGTAHTTTNSNSNTFVVLTDADLASSSVDDPIRISYSSSSSRLPFALSMSCPSLSSHPLSAALTPPARQGRTVKRQIPTTTTTTKSEELVSHRDAPSPPSSTSSLGLGSVSISISTSSLTLTSTSTLPFPSSVTVTPPFSLAPTPAPTPAPTLASPAATFHLRSSRALDADAAPDSDAGIAFDDANAKSDEEDKDKDALSLSLLLPPSPPLAISIRAVAEGMQISSYNIDAIIRAYVYVCLFFAVSIVILIGCPGLCDVTVDGGAGAGARACQHGHGRGHGYGHEGVAIGAGEVTGIAGRGGAMTPTLTATMSRRDRLLIHLILLTPELTTAITTAAATARRCIHPL